MLSNVAVMAPKNLVSSGMAHGQWLGSAHHSEHLRVNTPIHEQPHPLTTLSPVAGVSAHVKLSLLPLLLLALESERFLGHHWRGHATVSPRNYSVVTG